MSMERLPWIAEDPASLRLLELAQKVATAATTLLISGESGTGKDHLARLVHELGPRRDAPFLKIDCASLPPNLVESELFGHELGAFTGAVERKLGRFELGGTGTIVLDEVAALTPGAQGKLLRVLQERTFERLGGTETLRIEARIVALTNVDLTAAVASGHFREDLYFRLNVLALTVPPLRERRADILPLADHFLATLRSIHGHPGSHSANRRAACSQPTRGPAMSASFATRSSAPSFFPAATRSIPPIFPTTFAPRLPEPPAPSRACVPSKKSSAK